MAEVKVVAFFLRKKNLTDLFDFLKLYTHETLIKSYRKTKN